MNLNDQIDADFVSAMKARDSLKLETLRMVRSALKNEQISLGAALDDEKMTKVLKRLIKQRDEAAELYQSGERSELAQKEQSEAEIIKRYLPAEMNDAELETIIKNAINEINATAADFGKVMGVVMTKVGGQVDGARVSQQVRSLLANG